MKKVDLMYMQHVLDYVHERAFQKEMGYNEKDAEWDDSPEGRIGLELGRISACIESIFEIYEENNVSIVED